MSAQTLFFTDKPIDELATLISPKEESTEYLCKEMWFNRTVFSEP